jgi:hypothetical protein
MNGALTVYRSDVVAANEWKFWRRPCVFLLRFMRPSSRLCFLKAVMMPANPDAKSLAALSMQRSASLLPPSCCRQVVAANQVGVAA